MLRNFLVSVVLPFLRGAHRSNKKMQRERVENRAADATVE
jgi:fumarate reductase subunit D